MPAWNTNPVVTEILGAILTKINPSKAVLRAFWPEFPCKVASLFMAFQVDFESKPLQC
jgi:hypothetical protein